MCAVTPECLHLYIHNKQCVLLRNNETIVWMPSSKLPAFLIEEFETENEAAQSPSKHQEPVHVTNLIPTKEPPCKVQKHEHVIQEW